MSLIENPLKAEIMATKGDLNNLRVYFGQALDHIQNRLHPEQIVQFKPKTDPGKRAANIFLFDNHFGEKVLLRDGDKYNEYNFDIGDARMDDDFNQSVARMSLVGLDNFDEINILIGGDNVDGDGTVYPGQGGNIVGDIAEQIDRYANAVLRNVKRLCILYNDTIPINIIGIAGNHGATKSNNSIVIHARANNYDILTYKHIRNYLLGCQDAGMHNNVKMFFDHHFEHYKVDIKGWGFVMIHKTSKTMTTPSPKLKSLSTLLNYNAHALVSGHFHETELASIGGYKLIRCGSMAGANEYSDSLGILRGPAEQLLIITSANEMIESFHPIVLD